MNLLTDLEQGQSGFNKGIPYYEGMTNLSEATGGVRKKYYTVIAGDAKTGKTTLMNYCFVFSVYLHTLAHPEVKADIAYLCWEESRLDLEYNAACFFLHLDYNIDKIPLEESRTFRGENYVTLSASYLKGELVCSEKKLIKIHPKVLEKLEVVIKERLEPLYGVYDKSGKRIKEGFVDVVERKMTPQKFYEYVIRRARKEGEFSKDENGELKYIANNPKKLKLVVMDHIRKGIKEGVMSEKQMIDTMSAYIVELRNLLSWHFVTLIHMNRDAGNIDRLKMMGERMYPQKDGIKGSGNLLEDATEVITIFNPNEDAYNLKVHFKTKIRYPNGDPIYPNRRTAHIVAGRNSGGQGHFAFEFRGDLKHLKKFEE